MSQPQPVSPASARAPKQRFNVYTMMLIISFFAVAGACWLLWTELKRFGEHPQWDTTKVRGAVVDPTQPYGYAAQFRQTL